MPDANCSPTITQPYLTLLQIALTTVLIPSALALVRRLASIRDNIADVTRAISTINQWQADHHTLTESATNHTAEITARCREENRREFERLWDAINARRPTAPPPAP